MTDSILVQPPGRVGQATQLVEAGGPSVLINNPGPNTVYLGDLPSIQPTDGAGIVALNANGYVSADGTTDLYATIATGQTQSLNIITGVSNFFSPPSLSGLGGAAVYVQATTPTGIIPPNSLWFNTTTFALLSYTGGVWVNRQLSATQAIVAASITASQVANGTLTTAQIAAAAGILGTQIANATVTSTNIAANTIVAGNIAANTITAAQLAAGIVYAGIVNGTTIQGATFRLLNSFGAVDGLWDSGTDALFIYLDNSSAVQGAVISSIASKAVNDPVNSTAVPQGLFSQQLTLSNQGSAPPSFANASIFYSGSAGRPRYKSSAGADNIIQRSDINVAGIVVGNTTTPTLISTQLNYSAGEGQLSSEYEIELSGTLNWSSVTLNGVIMQLYVDGSPIGGGTATQWSMGVGGQTLSNISGFTVRFSISVISTGVGGTVVGRSDGTVWNQSANRIPANSVAVGAISPSVSFDSTINHTLQIYAWWNAVATGQQMNGYRTRVTRRN